MAMSKEVLEIKIKYHESMLENCYPSERKKHLDKIRYYKNRDKISEESKEKYKENPDEKRRKSIERYNENKDKINLIRNQKEKDKMENNPDYKEKERARLREYKRKNKEKLRIKQNEYRNRNRSTINEKQKIYRKSNIDNLKLYISNSPEYRKRIRDNYKERERVLKKEYRENNKEKVIWHNHQRLKHIKQATIGGDTWRKEIQEIYKKRIEQDPSGRELHVDHIIPLRGKNVSGFHCPWNLQIITKKRKP